MRRPLTLDEAGRVLGPAGRDRDARLGSWSPGVAVWEILHPEQVQAEYAAVGAPVPSRFTIIAGNLPAFAPINVLAYGAENLGPTVETASGAVNQVVSVIEDAAGSVADTVRSAGPWLVVGLVAFAAIEVLGRLPKGRG